MLTRTEGPNNINLGCISSSFVEAISSLNEEKNKQDISQHYIRVLCLIKKYLFKPSL